MRKAGFFLCLLDAKFGRERFDAFLRALFRSFRGQEHHHRAVRRLHAGKSDRPQSQGSDRSGTFGLGTTRPCRAVQPATPRSQAPPWLRAGGASRSCSRWTGVIAGGGAISWMHARTHRRTQLADLDRAFGCPQRQCRRSPPAGSAGASRQAISPAMGPLEEFLLAIGDGR